MKTKWFFRLLMMAAIPSSLLLMIRCEEAAEQPGIYITTVSPRDITGTSAIGGGIITVQGDATPPYYGICWDTTEYPQINLDEHTGHYGDKNVKEFSDTMKNLSPDRTYYMCAYVVGDLGETKYGSVVKFTTIGEDSAPTVDTYLVTDIKPTSATGGGNVTSSGSSSVTRRGVCWSKSEEPLYIDDHTNDGAGLGSFTSNITLLESNTTYYLRAYAENQNYKVGYGQIVTFTTSALQGCSGITSVTDSRDGKVYPTIEIGNQCWLQQNMNYKTGNSWCYGDQVSNCDTYGRLYDWQTVLEVCPSGWHLPDLDEWIILIDYLGGYDIAGDKMKETGSTHWASPNTNSNSSGFTALPGGGRYFNGAYNNISINAYFWSRDEQHPGVDAKGVELYYNMSNVHIFTNKESYGFSARCLLN